MSKKKPYIISAEAIEMAKQIIALDPQIVEEVKEIDQLHALLIVGNVLEEAANRSRLHRRVDGLPLITIADFRACDHACSDAAMTILYGDEDGVGGLLGQDLDSEAVPS